MRVNIHQDFRAVVFMSFDLIRGSVVLTEKQLAVMPCIAETFVCGNVFKKSEPIKMPLMTP